MRAKINSRYGKQKCVKPSVFSPLFLVLSLMIISAIFSWFSIPLRAQEQENIVETVYVENVEIPVRVFEGKEPVIGLKKTSFELFINGKRREINGFFETRKKLAQNTSPGPFTEDTGKTPAAGARLFALIFNLSDFQQDLAGHLDTLFREVIKPGDFIIVLTNRYFFPEWRVDVPEQTKGKIMAILDKEVKTLKSEMFRFENELRAISSELKSRLDDPMGMEKRSDDNFPLNIFRDFFVTYQFVLEDIKNQYLSLPVDQYIKIAGYMKGQQMEKWVLNFYQLGRLPLLNTTGRIYGQLNKYMDGAGGTVSTGGVGGTEINFTVVKEKLQILYFDFIMQLQKIDELYVKDIGKSFLNSGATVHTLLLKPIRQHDITGYDDYKYETVATDSESILKKMSELTGGSIVRSNKINDFITDITQKEDVVYILTYAPDPDRKRPPKVEIKIDNPGYRLVYDDQTRLRSFRNMMAQLNRLSKNIEIESISCNGDMLTAKLTNIELVQFEGEYFGVVRARVRILDNKKKTIVDFEKTYKGIKEEGIFQAKLPPIPNGSYKLILEVKDLFALKNVYAGDGINFTKTK